MGAEALPPLGRVVHDPGLEHAALHAADVAVEEAPEIGRPAAVGDVRLAGPRRSLWGIGVGVVSLLLGIAAMSVTFRVNPGFASAFEVAQLTETDVLGTVGAVVGTDAARRGRLRKWMTWGILLGAVVVTFVTACAMFA